MKAPKVITAGNPQKPRVGPTLRKGGAKARRGVKERAAKRGVLAAGARRTLEDERVWMDW
jgi:hypothetical protein